MPRKRRHAKRRPPLPQGLDQVSLCERATWAVSGPIMAGDVEPGAVLDNHHVWPSWAAFADFYESVRELWHADRPWRRERSAAERLYQSWLRGEDCDVVRGAIFTERHANDPRRLLAGGPHAA